MGITWTKTCLFLFAGHFIHVLLGILGQPYDKTFDFLTDLSTGTLPPACNLHVVKLVGSGVFRFRIFAVFITVVGFPLNSTCQLEICSALGNEFVKGWLNPATPPWGALFFLHSFLIPGIMTCFSMSPFLNSCGFLACVPYRSTL